MATLLHLRSVVSGHQSVLSFCARSLSSATSVAVRSPSTSVSSLVLRRALRPLYAAFSPVRVPPAFSGRCFATRTTTSSLRDPNPNWSNRPPKETILLDGCDFEHWLVVMEKPEGDPTRDEIIDSYIKTLAQVIGSEEEARMKIYSVSTRCYYAFGALVSEELSYKIKELPKVRWVLPDSYLDVRNKDYGGEPFINGQAVPYDPKYHEEWIKNNARAMERNRRNDRPKTFDRSRNFDRRRENRDFQNQTMQNNVPNAPPRNPGGIPPNNMGPTNPGNFGGMPANPQGGMPPSHQGGMPPSHPGGMPPNHQGGMPPYNQGGVPPYNQGGLPPNNFSRMPPNNQPRMPPNNMAGGMPPPNMGGGPSPSMGGMPPQNNMGGMQSPNSFGNMPPPPPPPPQNNMGGMPPQNNFTGSPPQGNMGGQQNAGYMSHQGWSNNIPERDPVNYSPSRDPSTVPGS